MIDTIKIYAEIDKTIYDKIRGNSVIKTSYNKKDGEIRSLEEKHEEIYQIVKKVLTGD